MDKNEIVPKNKHDLSVIKNIENTSNTDIKPFLPKLFEWIEDINWPVAQKLAPALVIFDDLIIPYIKDFIENPDGLREISVYKFMLPLLNDNQISLLKTDLENVITNPNEAQKKFECDKFVKEFLNMSK